MDNKVDEIMDILTEEIKKQNSKESTMDANGLILIGTIQGLELATKLINEYLEEV